MVRTARVVLMASTRLEKKCMNGAYHVDSKQSKMCFNGSGRARSQKRVIATPWPFETVETIAESAQNSDPLAQSGSG